MKTVCKGGEIDFDEMNRFDPDGNGPFCALSVAGYGSDVPASEKKRFLLTSDNGRVNCADLALKLMLDMGLRTGVPSLKYLRDEIARGCGMYHDGARELAYVPEESPAWEMLAEAGASRAMLPETALCVPHNFDALREHDMAGWMAGRKGLSRDMIKYLDGYVWIGRRARTFFGLCAAVADLLSAMSTDDVRIFLEGFYGVLGRECPEPDDPEPDDGGDDGPDADEDSAGGDTDVDTDGAPGAGDGPADGVLEAFGSGKIKVKGLSASDITGLDGTYALNYFDESYTRELGIRDSEGLFEGVLKSRINGTPAPVDILSEVVSEQNSGEAGQLRSKLSEIMDEIGERAEVG